MMSLAAIARECAAYAHLFLHRPPKDVCVLIFGQGRTGSTLLEDLLCSTGHFVKHGELLNKPGETIRFPAAYLKGRARRLRAGGFICHVKPSHLRDDRERVGARPLDLQAFIGSMTKEGFRIIHLKRSDRIGQFLSQRMAEARGCYHKFDDAPETRRVTIDRKQLEWWLERRRARDDREAAALDGFETIEVEYDADLADPAAHQATVDRILDSLALPPRRAGTSLRKVNRRPMRDIVENYDELASWLTELELPPPPLSS